MGRGGGGGFRLCRAGHCQLGRHAIRMVCGRIQGKGESWMGVGLGFGRVSPSEEVEEAARADAETGMVVHKRQ